MFPNVGCRTFAHINWRGFQNTSFKIPPSRPFPSLLPLNPLFKLLQCTLPRSNGRHRRCRREVKLRRRPHREQSQGGFIDTYFTLRFSGLTETRKMHVWIPTETWMWNFRKIYTKYLLEFHWSHLKISFFRILRSWIHLNVLAMILVWWIFPEEIFLVVRCIYAAKNRIAFPFAIRSRVCKTYTDESESFGVRFGRYT